MSFFCRIFFVAAAVAFVASFASFCSRSESREKRKTGLKHVSGSLAPSKKAVDASDVGISEGPLSKPRTDGGVSLDRALATRRSVREFGKRRLTSQEVSQLLWAGQGKTSPRGLRTVPSAGATFPLEIRLVSSEGVFRYDSGSHSLERLASNDRRGELAKAALGQRCVSDAAADFVVAGVVSRTSWKYGKRAERYVAIEAGAAAQSMLLEAVALDLGAVIVGAFDDSEVREISALTDESVPLAIVAVGSKSK